MNNDELQVIITPDLRKGNPYLTLLGNALQNYNCQPVYAQFPKGPFQFYKLTKAFPHARVLHLHWISDLILETAWTKSNIIFLLKIMLLYIDLVLIKAKGVRLIWTIHNKYAHMNFDHKRELTIRKIIYKCSDQVILHSDYAVEVISDLYGIEVIDKTKVIFHGNYVDCYPKPSKSRNELRESFGFDDNDVVYLFFGSIRPYKGIERLIDAFEKIDECENRKLMIAGGTNDHAYEKAIKQRCKSDKIIKDIRFIPDQVLIDYLSVCDAVVIPFSDTLTSGSTILSMTVGRGLVLPEAAQVFGCVPGDGVQYFEDFDQFVKILRELDREVLKKMGRANYIKAQSMPWDLVAKMTYKLYKTE